MNTKNGSFVTWLESLSPQEKERAATAVRGWMKLNRQQRRRRGIMESQQTLETITFLLENDPT